MTAVNISSLTRSRTFVCPLRKRCVHGENLHGMRHRANSRAGSRSSIPLVPSSRQGSSTALKALPLELQVDEQLTCNHSSIVCILIHTSDCGCHVQSPCTITLLNQHHNLSNMFANGGVPAAERSPIQLPRCEARISHSEPLVSLYETQVGHLHK